jgi:DNA-binding beta-propeller fold protein YncE
MDENAGLLYVSHGTIVQVINVKDGKLTATIEDTKGVHGITIARGFGKGYISCGKDSSVVVFDIKTFRTLSKIKVNMDQILMLFCLIIFSKRVFVFNGRSKNVSVIDATKDQSHR